MEHRASPSRFLAVIFGVLLVTLLAINVATASTATSRRSLQQDTSGVGGGTDTATTSDADTAPTQCTWTNTGCALNANFVTTLSGAPTTESQKLIARTAALSKVCRGFDTSTTCLANPANLCSYDILKGVCYLGNGFINLNWLLGRVYCPGSLAEIAATCLRASSNQTACTSNNNCLWDPSGLSSLASLWMGGVADWVNSGDGVNSCTAKWANDLNVWADLANKWTAALNVPVFAFTTNSQVAIFKDIFGKCNGAAAYQNLAKACISAANLNNHTACESTLGCAWTGSSAAVGLCDLDDNFPVALLLNQSDPWVTALQAAEKTCLPLAETACDASAAITVNLTRYTDFATANPVFPIGDTTGAAGAPAAPAARVILLGLLVAFLLALFSKSS